MQTIRIQCPAKINLKLKITGKLDNGFHAIESVMQTISLYDYLIISVADSDKNEIMISGNSIEIPYDETNLAYKAANLYLETVGIKNKKINIYIEKNIPVSAGLAGGSSDAAGVLYGLDKLFKMTLKDKIFYNSETGQTSKSPAKRVDMSVIRVAQKEKSYLDKMCAKLGSDLNVCLHGGKILAQGRGEIITPLKFRDFNLSLIKPIYLGISAKDAYTMFSQKKATLSTGMKNNFLMKSKFSLREDFVNDLEWAVIDNYPELRYIKQKYPKAIMTGSGSTYFMIDGEFGKDEGYWVKNGLKAVDFGVRVV